MAKTQSPARKAWGKYYRLHRIIAREVHKATMDTLIFGVGAVKIGPGFIQRVDPRVLAR